MGRDIHDLKKLKEIFIRALKGLDSKIRVGKPSRNESYKVTALYIMGTILYIVKQDNAEHESDTTHRLIVMLNRIHLHSPPFKVVLFSTTYYQTNSRYCLIRTWDRTNRLAPGPLYMYTVQELLDCRMQGRWPIIIMPFCINSFLLLTTLYNN